MDELVKKEPVTLSPDTTSSSRLVTLDARKASRSSVKKKPIISSPTSRKLVVIDVHTASSSSSRTSSDSEKEIEKLTNQSHGSESQATPPKKIWVSKFKGKGSFEKFHRKRIASKYYRMQKLKNADGSYKKKQSSKPRAPGKCFKCGKRGHLRTKCESKDRTFTNTIICNELVSTFEPEIRYPKWLSLKPKVLDPKRK